MTFGERLKFARKEKKLTQKELALKIGAKHNSISNWENDQNMPDPDTIQHLCWALDVQPNYFFALSERDREIEKTLISSHNDIRVSDLSMEDKLRISLKQLGILDDNDNLSDADLAFLQYMLLAIEAHFKKPQ